VGIFSSGLDIEVASSVVEDTLPEEATGRFGRGIGAQCDLDADACGSLDVTASLVKGSRNVGIYVSGVPAVIDGVAVVDTTANETGDWEGSSGQGVWVLCDDGLGSCATLQMTSCLVDSSFSAGLATEGTSGFVLSSVIRNVSAEPLDGKYGYGIQIEGLEGQAQPTFHVTGCEVLDAKLAGIMYYLSSGTLSGSVVRGGEFSVVKNVGSSPTILDDNELSGTVTSEPTWQDFYPSPAPPPSGPGDMLDGR